MRVELHCHSLHSDGSFPAAEVARRAQRTGVELFCLTDHDTCGGFDDTVAVLGGGSCRVLRGLELSCRANGRTVHVLLYGLQPGEGLVRLQERLDAIHSERRDRLRRICGRLAGMGIHVDADRLLSRTHGRTPGRPDVARALIEQGVVSTPQEAFARFLRDGGPADVPLERLSVADGVALGLGAGARASLAHPHTFGDFAQVRALVAAHRDCGLQGLEAYYGSYARAESEGWLRLCDEFALVPTGGSDFHGDMNPAVTQPGITLPPGAGERITAWLGL
ncbi:MAG: PHP domain-containing protein [Nannocystaceae bacterium]|nr:PHP domain-containing protein [Nannocystaceae bacterium]